MPAQLPGSRGHAQFELSGISFAVGVVARGMFFLPIEVWSNQRFKGGDGWAARR